MRQARLSALSVRPGSARQSRVTTESHVQPVSGGRSLATLACGLAGRMCRAFGKLVATPRILAIFCQPDNMAAGIRPKCRRSGQRETPKSAAYVACIPAVPKLHKTRCPRVMCAPHWPRALASVNCSSCGNFMLSCPLSALPGRTFALRSKHAALS